MSGSPSNATQSAPSNVSKEKEIGRSIASAYQAELNAIEEEKHRDMHV